MKTVEITSKKRTKLRWTVVIESSSDPFWSRVWEDTSVVFGSDVCVAQHSLMRSRKKSAGSVTVTSTYTWTHFQQAIFFYFRHHWHETNKNTNLIHIWWNLSMNVGLPCFGVQWWGQNCRLRCRLNLCTTSSVSLHQGHPHASPSRCPWTQRSQGQFGDTECTS